MSSDAITMPGLEWLRNSDKNVRLFAYSCAISGKEGKAVSSKGKAKEDSGITGLMSELEKTKLDV